MIVDYTEMADEILSAKEPTILPKGSEVKVRIIRVRTGEGGERGCQYFSPVFEVLGEGNEMVQEFSDFHWLLDRACLDAKTYERSKLQFKKFAQCFGLDLARPFDLEELVGLEGWVIVGVKESKDYGLQNFVSSYVINR